MKYILTLIAGYLLPSVAPHVSLDVCLGIAAGVLFGLLVAMLFIGPTPALAPQPVTPRVNKTQRKPKTASVIAKATDYELFPKSVANMPVVNYEWSAA